MGEISKTGGRESSPSLIKQLLTVLEEKCLPKERTEKASLPGLRLYRAFLLQCMNFRVQLDTLGMLQDDLLRDFFGTEEEEPQFLTFYDKNADLVKLSNLLKINLVIYFFPGHGSTKKRLSGPVYKFLDSRLSTKIVEEEVDQEGGTAAKTDFFFLLHRKNGIDTLTLREREEAEREYMAGWSESPFMSERNIKTKQTNGCFLQALIRLLHFPPTEQQSSCSLDLPKCPDLFSLLSSIGEPSFYQDSRILALLKKKKIFLAYHVGTEGRYKTRRGGDEKRNGITSPSNQFFRVLASFPSSKGLCTKHQEVVVCFVHPDQLYIPKDKIADEILRTAKLPPGGSIKTYLRGKRKGEKGKEKEETSFSSLPYRVNCDCGLCQASVRYLPNFLPGGLKSARRSHLQGRPCRIGQRAYKSELDCQEFLKLFKLDTTENLEKIESACYLSMACMDVESCTTLLPHGHTVDEGVRLEFLSSFRHDSSPRYSQNIVLFAHLDHLKDEEGEERAKFFRVTKEKPLRELVVEYVQYIRERKKKAEEEKRLLLKPLMNFVEIFREAHASFSQDHMGMTSDKEKEKAFKQTLFGRFEIRLKKLIETYYTFGFQSRGYDHVLLAAPLACAASRVHPPARFRMQRLGNKIKWMKIDKIVFKDICDMSDPRASLSSLAATCNLEVKKQIFPFRQMSSLSSLDDPCLSRDKNMWKSDLTNKCPSQEEIDEAIKTFEEKGYSSLFEWLCFYLEKDCQLTLQASTILIARFAHTLGTNPIDAGKLTISSFSNYIGQVMLQEHKRPALFSPTVPCLYEIIKSATKGGLVACHRSESQFEGKKEGGINGELITGLCQASSNDIKAREELEEDLKKRGQLYDNSLNIQIDKILDKWGREKMLPYEAASVTSEYEPLSAARQLLGAHEALKASKDQAQKRGGGKARKWEDGNHPLGRPIDFVHACTPEERDAFLTPTEADEGPLPGHFVHDKDLNSLYAGSC